MSVSKIVVLAIVAGVILFIILIIYSLSPTIRNVSKKEALSPLINKKLKLKRTGYIQKFEEGQYRFRSNVLTDYIQYTTNSKHELPIGTEIVFTEFKTYKNNLGSGFTSLFGLGEVEISNGERIEFEYSWGSVDPSENLDEPEALPITTPLWKDKVK